MVSDRRGSNYQSADFDQRKAIIVGELLLDASAEQIINSLRIKRYLELMFEEYGMDDPELYFTCPEQYKDQWGIELFKFKISSLNYLLSDVMDYCTPKKQKNKNHKSDKLRGVIVDVDKKLHALNINSLCSIDQLDSSKEKFSKILRDLCYHLDKKSREYYKGTLDFISCNTNLKIVDSSEFKSLNFEEEELDPGFDSTDKNYKLSTNESTYNHQETTPRVISSDFLQGQTESDELIDYNQTSPPETQQYLHNPNNIIFYGDQKIPVLGCGPFHNTAYVCDINGGYYLVAVDPSTGQLVDFLDPKTGTSLYPQQSRSTLQFNNQRQPIANNNYSQYHNTTYNQ